ncbi:hypothetical protein P3342_012836 [Pyrenophora teres f. teres]|nr:hypothetical protein P3342_012836 [Pyrenophora teres f. teres]
MVRTPPGHRVTLQPPIPLRYGNQGITRCPNSDNVVSYNCIVMAMRRGQQRSSKLEELLPILLTIKGLDPNFSSTRAPGKPGHADPVRCERRTKIPSARRQQPLSTTHHVGHRRSTNTPFQFFELPQEIRDEVYSYLVVHQSSPRSPPILDATTILKNRKKRLAARKTRDRMNLQRLSDGKRPICPRTTNTEPILHMDLVRTSQRLAHEATDCMYTKNWFAISLSKLPQPTFEVPQGWDTSRIKRLQVEVQLKDAIRMNRYIDWASFFTAFPSLQFLRIVPTLHPRYYEWARLEFCDWASIPFVHKAFFRELLAAIPRHVDLTIGMPVDADLQIQGKVALEEKLLWDMYIELGNRVDGAGKLIPVSRVLV